MKEYRRNGYKYPSIELQNLVGTHKKIDTQVTPPPSIREETPEVGGIMQDEMRTQPTLETESSPSDLVSMLLFNVTHKMSMARIVFMIMHIILTSFISSYLLSESFSSFTNHNTC
jgi:hypothetical protein